MKSIFLLCGALGAVANASECQADENSLLQATKRIRKHAQTDSQAVLNKLRDVANSLLEGSDAAVTSDEVSDALDAASNALAQLSPAIRQQIQNAQQQVNDAMSAVQACHAQEQAQLRSSLQVNVQRRVAAVESCQDTLGRFRADETQQCGNAEDCLCDEARVRTTDQEALCASMTETYEEAFCEHHHVCTIFQQCHSTEAEVYQRMRADVEAEMELVVQEYIAVEQSRCLTGLIMTAMTPPVTPISHEALVACDNVDASALHIAYSDMPAEPAACPAPTHGNPAYAVGVDLDNIQPREGSPAGCTCTLVEVPGYSAGPVVRCDNCIDTYRSTDANSCPSGFKLFSPRNQQDWDTIASSVAQSDFSKPDFIFDVTRPEDGCGGCTQHLMNSDTEAQSSWVTSDGSPWFLRSSPYNEPNGDYTANCYMTIRVAAVGDVTFNDLNCNYHSNTYLCQVAQRADMCSVD